MCLLIKMLLNLMPHWSHMMYTLLECTACVRGSVNLATLLLMCCWLHTHSVQWDCILLQSRMSPPNSATWQHIRPQDYPFPCPVCAQIYLHIILPVSGKVFARNIVGSNPSTAKVLLFEPCAKPLNLNCSVLSWLNCKPCWVKISTKQNQKWVHEWVKQVKPF